MKLDSKEWYQIHLTGLKNNLTNLEMIQENVCGFVPWSNGYLCIYLRVVGKITSEEATGTKIFSFWGSDFQTNL